MKFSTFFGCTLAVTGIALTVSILPASAKSEKPEKPAEVVKVEKPAEAAKSEKPAEAAKSEKPAEVAKSEKPAEAAKPEKLGKSNTKEVPEPLTILGSVAALGLGSMLKKQADKNKNQAFTKDTLSS